MNIPRDAIMIENNMAIRKADYPRFIRALRHILKRPDWNKELTDEAVTQLCGFNLHIPGNDGNIWLDWYTGYIVSEAAPDDDEILIAIAPYVIDGGHVTFEDYEEQSYFGVSYHGGKAYKITGHIAWEEDDEPLTID